MTRIRAGSLAAAAAAALLAAGCAGTTYGTSSGGSTVCRVHDSIKLDAGVILGTAIASCTIPPTAHHLAVYLRYQPGGSSAPTGTMRTMTSDQIPAPGVDVTLTARHTCLPGTWWVQVVIAGTSPDGTPFSASDSRKYGTVSLNDCNRP